MGSWAQVEVVLPRPRSEEVGFCLLQAGAGGLQEDHLPGEAPPPRQPWDRGPRPPPTERMVLRAWLPGQGFASAWAALEAELLRAGGLTAAWRPVQDEDWAETWRAAFRRVEVSPTLAVAPPWLARPGDLVIDPGMAFGTGEHPTTRFCLAWTERLAGPGGTCLDVGTGSGVVAILAGRQGMAARGIDIDPEAVKASLENAERNGVPGLRFDDSPLGALEGRWSLVVANIYGEVLARLAPDLARVTAPGGRLVLAGILADRGALVQQAMEAQGLALEVSEPDGDWLGLVFRASAGGAPAVAP